MNEQQTIKLCACGCGEPVKLETSTYKTGHCNKRKDVIDKAKFTRHITCSLYYGKSYVNQYNTHKIINPEPGLCKCGCGKKVTRYGNKYLQGHYRIKMNSVIRLKIRKTCLLRYGVESTNQLESVKEKKKNTILYNYGVDNPMKCSSIVDSARSAMRISAIKRIEEQTYNGEPMIPSIGTQERIFLNELQKFTEYKIIRNDATFRYIVGRFPDGHIPELKLFIQFDERHHFVNQECTQYREEDIQCTRDLESLPGYRVFRVSEKSWKENKEQVIFNFQTIIKESKSINNE